MKSVDKIQLLKLPKSNYINGAIHSTLINIVTLTIYKYSFDILVCPEYRTGKIMSSLMPFIKGRYNS